MSDADYCNNYFRCVVCPSVTVVFRAKAKAARRNKMAQTLLWLY